MSRRILFCFLVGVLGVTSATAQQFKRFNFNVGGGFDFPLTDMAKFTQHSYQGTVGGGVNLNRLFGVNAEYMYDNLSFKDSVINGQSLPDASGRVQSATLNVIFNVPTHGKWGLYAIGGGGWYQRSVDARQQVLVPGTVCQPAWALWAVSCTNGLITQTQTLSSHTDSAGGYNYGGGITYRWKSRLRPFVEMRYHHANLSNVHNSILPVTFGIRW